MGGSAKRQTREHHSSRLVHLRYVFSAHVRGRLSACQGAAVDVEVGVDVTLTVGLRTAGETGVPSNFAVSLGDNPDGVFQVLEPSSFLGSTVDGETTFAFIAVNAPAAGTYSVDVNVSAGSAANAPEDGSPVVVSLTVNAVEP